MKITITTEYGFDFYHIVNDKNIFTIFPDHTEPISHYLKIGYIFIEWTEKRLIKQNIAA